MGDMSLALGADVRGADRQQAWPESRIKRPDAGEPRRSVVEPGTTPDSQCHR